MLGDVLEVAVAFSDVVVVTDDPAGALLAEELRARVVTDPGGGQGAAVRAGLECCEGGPCLVVNADLPGVCASDLAVLAVPASGGAVGLVPAEDGTTNALALPRPGVFEPLYGSGSAQRFRALAESLGLSWQDVDLPNLRADVDTLDDLERLGAQLGVRTRSLLRVSAA
jgi:2-phospho-L-lactate guanylyltransferase